MTQKFFILLIGLGLMVSACSHPPGNSEFVVAIESFPSNLDPRYPADAYSSKVQRLIFNGLLKLNEHLLLVPDLADRYEYLSDTRLRFHLRSGVRFHDGGKLTAYDVQYTFRSLMDPAKHSPLYGVFKKIEKIQVLDDYNLEIRLKEPFAPLLTALTVGIIPKDSDERDSIPFSERPIGTGPFRFVSLRSDQWIHLKAFENYFENPPHIQNLVIQTVRDDTTRVLKLLKGDVDLVQNAVPLVMADWLRRNSNLKMVTDTGINYAYLAFNLKDPILKNLKVREAIALALDRDTLIKYQLRGFGRQATGILAPSNWYYEPEVSQLPYDPTLAKKLLEEAGYRDPDGEGPAKRFTLIYKTSNKRDRIAMARAIARQLEAVGIGVEIRPFEWGTFYRDIRTGNFQIFSSTWVGVTDPDIFYEVFYSGMIPPLGANRGYYVNKHVDALLDLARSETNAEERKKFYSQVQKMLALELPYVSLWYEDNVVFMRPNVVGYTLSPDASLMGLVQVKKLSGKEEKK